MSNTNKKHISEDFVVTEFKGLKRHKTNSRVFLFDFRVHGKRYRKKFQVQATNHTAAENKEEAYQALLKYKTAIRKGHSLNNNTTLDECFYDFMKNKERTAWNEKLVRNYRLYIGECNLFMSADSTHSSNSIKNPYSSFKVGHRKISEIEVWHLEKILHNMEIHGLKERTRNSIFEILNPLYKWLVERKIVEENIANSLKVTINVKKQKRIVVNAEELYQKIYATVLKTYADDPYYRAIFLFALNGRRKGEILNLKWQYIDFKNNTYVLEDPKAADHQSFYLNTELKEALLQIPDTKRGYVFKSPVKKGQPLKNIDRQVGKLKELLNDENLCMHFFRHVLVSTLADKGISKVQLSALLGHEDLQSINRYISVDRVEAGKQVSPVIKEIMGVLDGNAKEEEVMVFETPDKECL